MPILRWLNDEEARKKASQIPYRLLEAFLSATGR